jgi:anti-sigma B factor antagonist
MENESARLDLEERYTSTWIRGGLRVEPLVVEEEIIKSMGVVVSRLKGKLNVETVPGFDALMRSETAPLVMLEMSGVDYLDTAGVGALARLYVARRASGKGLALANLTEPVYGALKSAGLAELLPIYPTLGFSVTEFGSSTLRLAEDQQGLSHASTVH